MQNDNDKKKHLIRSLSPLNVWSLAFGCVIGWSSFVMPGTVFLPSAGPLGTLIAMEIATFVMLIISYNYSYMIHKFPLTGGEFIYAKMAFGNHHGFLCAWFLGLAYLSVIPLNATALNLVTRAVFGDAFCFGFHYHIAGYEVWFGEMLLAFTVLLIFTFINSKGVHITGKLQTYLVMILLGGILIVIAATLMNPDYSSVNFHPMFHPLDETFNKGIAAQIIAVFVTGPLSFVGFDTVPQLMEESNFSSDSVKVTMDTSIICGSFVYIALTLFACAVIPSGYSDWHEYVSDLPNIARLYGNGIMTLRASYLVLGNTGLFFLVSSAVAAMLTGIIGFYMATSRLLFSMSRDGMIPKWFSYINKNGVPTHAGLFCMVVSCLICLLGRPVMGWIFDMASTGAAIGFAYTSIAAAKYAWYERRIDILIFGILGFILSLGMATFLLIPIPGLNVSMSTESYGFLLIWSVLGLMFYGLERGRTKSS
jgi:amino acid transporter